MNWLKALPYIITTVVIGLLVYWVYDLGSSHGAEVVQEAWNQQKEEDRLAREKKQQEYDEKEAQHREKANKVTHELAEAQRLYEVSLARQRADFGQRLLLSTNRAALYQRQAESGSAECGSLARHAAELDRSLEEGRSLVRELRDTVGLRDQQLRQLSTQILADRQLLN